MKKITVLLTLAGAAGIGYCIYKKLSEKKEGSSSYTEYKEESCGDKVRRASMYAVGTIRTTADKISEGIKQVRTGDMVKKGEETVEQVKETTDEIKEHVKETTGEIREEIKELKNLVTSINTSPADAVSEIPETNVFADKDDDDEIDLFDTVEAAEQL